MFLGCEFILVTNCAVYYYTWYITYSTYRCSYMYDVLEELEREKKLNTALERDVVNIEERQEYEHRLKALNEKRPWVVSCSTL